MYNRYIPQDTGWTRVSEADFPPGPAAPRPLRPGRPLFLLAP